MFNMFEFVFSLGITACVSCSITALSVHFLSRRKKAASNASVASRPSSEDLLIDQIARESLAPGLARVALAPASTPGFVGVRRRFYKHPADLRTYRVPDGNVHNFLQRVEQVIQALPQQRAA